MLHSLVGAGGRSCLQWNYFSTPSRAEHLAVLVVFLASALLYFESPPLGAVGIIYSRRLPESGHKA
jgi:hypothetical protein